MSPEAQAKVIEAVQKVAPLKALIKANTKYLIQTGRLSQETADKMGELYIRRHYAMFDPATRKSYVPPVGSEADAAAALVKQYHVTANEAHDMLQNWRHAS